MLLDTLTPENLFAGNVFPVVTGKGTITGGNYTRGTVLGEITASKKLTKVDSSKVDGSQTVFAVLAEDTDASLGDKIAPIYLTGEFNEEQLVFGGADTADTHRSNARKVSIFFKTLG
jgi:hypothetical protein